MPDLLLDTVEATQERSGECAFGRFRTGRPGKPDGMIFWSKRNGRPAKVRFLWWPLVLSLAVSIGVTLLLNMGR